MRISGSKEEAKAVLDVARLMLLAARTAPKGKGVDDLETLILTEKDKDVIARELYAMGENLQRELIEEEQVMLRQIMNEVMIYLEEYNKQYNYKYIFSNSFGGQLLYTDKSLNITNDVLKGLNESYAKSNE